MRRADRLFEIIQFMRRQPLTRARDLAEHFEVSDRTIYRDIQDLMTSGVPIEGEAGIGYVLRAGYDLPPLMFKETELEALVLGARIVQSWGDKELAGAATDVIAKVEAVLPEALRTYMNNTAPCWPRHTTAWSQSALICPNCAPPCATVALSPSVITTPAVMRLRARSGRCHWRISGLCG
jgi:predicted DNA-binding transcriptional regulator YafY